MKRHESTQGLVLYQMQELHDEMHNHPMFSHAPMGTGEWIHIHSGIPVEVSSLETAEEWEW